MEQNSRPNPIDNVPNLHPQPPKSEGQGKSSEGSESYGSEKSRSRSPTKRLGDLQFSDMQVDPRAWSSSRIPTELKALVADMQKISRSFGVIPLAVKERLATADENILDFQWTQDGGKYHGGKHSGVEEEKSATDRITRGLGHDVFWDRAVTIYQANIECLDGGYPEPAWNSEVHSRILRLTLTGHWKAKEVWYMSVTVARISND